MLLFVQQLCQGRALNLHGTFGAEFLTTEAADARLAVDAGFAIHHGDGLGGANFGAFFAADAFIGSHCRTGGDGVLEEGGEQLSKGAFEVVLEQKAVLGFDLFEVRNKKLDIFIITYNSK